MTELGANQPLTPQHFDARFPPARGVEEQA